MRRKAFRVEETLRVIDHVNIHWTSIHLKIIPIDLLTKTTSATVHVALPPYSAIIDHHTRTLYQIRTMKQTHKFRVFRPLCVVAE